MTNRTRLRQAQWQHLIEQQRHSGLNATVFCRQQKLWEIAAVALLPHCGAEFAPGCNFKNYLVKFLIADL
ncbi:MAG: IS66 family insertion sequence element accessory protein TnpA [Arenicellales bacterium WSBS_2016_MAG_OTU3]